MRIIPGCLVRPDHLVFAQSPRAQVSFKQFRTKHTASLGNDDFAGQHWYNFAEQMRKVLPEARLVPLDTSHPIFDSFFHIESLDFDHPNYPVKAQFLGVFEDNDPNKRLLLVANYNHDLGELWEFSDTGFVPVDLTNDAYKYGVNYIVYAMTH